MAAELRRWLGLVGVVLLRQPPKGSRGLSPGRGIVVREWWSKNGVVGVVSFLPNDQHVKWAENDLEFEKANGSHSKCQEDVPTTR